MDAFTRYWNKAYLLALCVFLVFLSAYILAQSTQLPIIRLVIWSILLLFIPGYCVIKIFYIEPPTRLHLILLSIGISVVFIMLYGWVYNQISIGAGFQTPLSTRPLSLAFLLPDLALVLIAFRRYHKIEYHIALSGAEKKIVLIGVAVLVTIIAGTYVMNWSGNNIIIIIGLIFLMSSFLLAMLFDKMMLSKDTVYPILIFCFALSVLLMWGLRLDHIIGVDAHLEYYLFSSTVKAGKWDIFLNTDVDSMLSVTLLPAIFFVLAGIKNMEMFFKIFYPLLFSIAPLVIYVTVRKYLTPLQAFISSFFFISFINFQMTTAQARTNIAILFVAFMVLTLTMENVKPFQKKIIFILFALGVIWSHYSTAYIIFSILLAMAILQPIVRWCCQKNLLQLNYDSAPTITWYTIALFFVVLFLWYAMITYSPFHSGVTFMADVLNRLQYMFAFSQHSSADVHAIGIGLGRRDWPYRLEVYSGWLCNLFIVVGFVYVSCAKHSKRLNVDVEYWLFSFTVLCILFLTITIPYISVAYDFARVFLLSSIVLALYLPVGVSALFKGQYKVVYTNILLSFAILLYFASQTGLIFQLFGVPQSVVLNNKGTEYMQFYIASNDAASAKWLGENINGQIVYTDAEEYILYSQAMIPPDRLKKSGIFTPGMIDGFVYLRRNVIIDNGFSNSGEEVITAQNYDQQQFNYMHYVYDNGYSHIWKSIHS